MSSFVKCQSCRKDFYIDESDINFYKKMQVPAPTFCPSCRFFRRMCENSTHGHKNK